MKKLLILGGKPIGSTEIVNYAKKRNIYTIVADYLPDEESPAKKISDEQWNISVADVDVLVKKVIEEKVDAVIAGVHEFCIRKSIEISEKAGLKSWCTISQWDNCSNKKDFKKLCIKHNIPVARTYKLEDPNIQYPVIVKPVDSDGSRGFSICNNIDELQIGVKNALNYSNDYLIEEYMNCDACIIHYTAIDGKIVFCGISDKYSQKLENGSMVMALQIFPSKEQEKYLSTVNQKAIEMFESIGIKNGPIWIEAFKDKGRFVFNEMALRIGGSMTNYPVRHFYGINQLEMMIDNILGEKSEYNDAMWEAPTKKYCILPIHLKSGKIKSIQNLDIINRIKYVNKVVLVHNIGDEIQNWGTAQQVFCYLHIKYDEDKELSECIKEVKNSLKVISKKNEDMLFYLFDLSKLNV
mgnify:CR=1 FL=1